MSGGRPLDNVYDRVVVQPTEEMATTFKNACMSHGLTKDLNKRVFSKVAWAKTLHGAGVQVLYEEAQYYLPTDAAVITITADGNLKALTNYNIATA